jgi:hypothetical protein
MLDTNSAYAEVVEHIPCHARRTLTLLACFSLFFLSLQNRSIALFNAPTPMHAIPFASSSSFSSDSSCFNSEHPPCPQELLPCSPLPFRSHHAQRKQSACCSDAGASHCDEEAPSKAPRLPPLFRLERTNIALECAQSSGAVAVVVEALEAALLNARCNILRRRRQKCRWACQYLVGCGDFVDLRVKLFSFQVCSTMRYHLYIKCCSMKPCLRILLL